MIRRLLTTTAVAAFLASACSVLPMATESKQPKPCAVVYSVARCDAMTDIVAADIGKDRDDVTAVAIVPDAPPGGVHLSAGWHIRVRIALRDGSIHDKEICGGVLHEAACLDDPRLQLRSAIDGYRDVPEGSSPIPALESSAKRAASPIRVASLSIPIDRQGEQEVDIGEGSIPNGVWSIGTFEFAEPWPDDVALRDATVVLELRSLERGGKPFENMYVHGWRDGVERVRAVVRFDV
ncbi:MAG TPA: hypothetical protein VFN41_06225, partial [Candidatus Limnocylindrales bacterium]|nr:hypothetical protein [Candidatus Limnocylindrales bacterium]